jgi:uncharacterized protein
MKTKNPFTLLMIHQMQNHTRIMLFMHLVLGMFCLNCVAQPGHRKDLMNVPVINMHTHPLRTLGDALSTEEMDKELKLRVAAMDESGIRKTVLLCIGFETNKAPNLSQLGSEREAFYFLKAEPERFVVYTTVDFSQMNSPDFTAKAIEHLENTVRAGARGLKFELGKPDMHWMPMDDIRLDPIYDKASELGIPVMYHSNDPEDFFYPVNQFNFFLGANKGKAGSEQGYWERQEKFVSREQLFRERESMLRKHPNTTFILAHFGWLERQLPLMADIFDHYPNVFVDVSSAITALGRSPKESAAFINYYSKRILFGTDFGGNSMTQIAWKTFMDRHFTILESDQDNLPAPVDNKAWKVHGLNLSKEVLERIYYKNAEELLARPVKVPPAR